MRDTLVTDYANFYAVRNLGRLLAGLGAGAVLAHTNADAEIRQWFQQSLRDDPTNEVSRTVKPLGNGWISIPIFAGAAALGLLNDDPSSSSVTATWGQRSFRALLVGVPPMLLLQKAIGASRPLEAKSRPLETDSHWQPFIDDNGVSGHSFMGAVPFLSAAMLTEKPALKVLWYTGSTLCGLSRLNDDQHYFSQVVLGWWLAYLSVKSVSYTDEKTVRLQISPMAWQHGTGLNLRIIW